MNKHGNFVDGNTANKCPFDCGLIDRDEFAIHLETEHGITRDTW